jgi:imidazolonepropionase-like amidohydrolase/Tol biopolymer transport system component
MTKHALLACAFAFLSFAGAAQEKKEAKWDINDPKEPFKEISFTTTEGTWMNLDVSPDGKEIVFDLMGDIYLMPVTGGDAKLLRGGYAYEVQPRFSPDGSKILFTSDTDGADNIWYMKRDGSKPEQITKEDFRLLNNAVWTPDGNYIIARKHFTNTRSAGAGEMWMYHVSGGTGIGLTKRKNDQQDVNEPTISPDGRFLYFSEDMYPGGYFQYNKDPNKQIYVIRRYDMQDGKLINIIEGPGGAFRPQISRDGKKLAFVRRVREKTVLFVHDLATGEQKPVFDDLGKDQSEAWAIFGVYTGYNWLPDNKHIVIWAKGKIWKVDTENKTASEIPFKVEAKHRITEAVKFEQKAFTDKFNAKIIRHAVTSPDGKYLVFNAVGYLWKKELPGGKPVRITQSTDFEFEPAFSKDGKTLAYVTWNDAEKGAVMTLNLADAKAKPVKITSEKGIYRQPNFSPDGTKIAFLKEDGNEHQGFSFCKNPGLYWIAANGGKMNFIGEYGEKPQFNKSGDRIFYHTGGYLFGALEKSIASCRLDGTDIKTHFTSKYMNQYAISPDNEFLAFGELHQVYLAAFPKSGKSMDLSARTTDFPVSKISRDAGINLHFSGDGKKIHWTLGDEYFTDELRERFKFLAGAPDSIPPVDTLGIKVNLELTSDAPKGLLAFKNARIITMKGNEVLENATILVENNRIKAVGKDIEIPASAKVTDCTGKTIMPGIVDVHAHAGDFRYGLSPRQNWYYYANLAFGITTIHDPSTNSEMIFAHSEMQKAGEIVAPRLFSTGTILYGADGDFKAVINSLDDARSALRRTKAYGAFSVKSYNQPRRNQRQWVIRAARELGMLVVPEGGSHFFHNMSMVLDGHTGVEHNIPVAPLYNDVLQVWGASKTGNTPTLIVNYGGINGEYYWYQNTEVWKNERLLTFMPRSIVDSRSRHRTMIPQEEYENGHILVSKSCKKLTDAGVKINVGGHGQLQGLGVHWEIWMLHQGGMTEHEALQAATINGASYIGMDKEIGSLEVGKLADFLILDKNPLENIRNTESITHTIINGRVYDAQTMHEVISSEQKRAPFWFENHPSEQNFPWHETTHSFERHACSCGKH